MAKRKRLEELTITDDFIFGAVMQNPARCKKLLEMVLGMPIREIRYPELQKSMKLRYESRGIRLDVYVEDDQNTVYNIEIQTSSNKNLPRRTRYYRGMIDLNVLQKGMGYKELKKSFVIFFCTYDPFGSGRYVYTFESRCVEELNLQLGDESRIIVLNTKGYKGEISRELRELLRYMDGAEPDSEYTKNLHRDVEEVKESKEWRREYMVMMERDRNNIDLGKYAEKVAIIRGFGSESVDAKDKLAKTLRIQPQTVTLILNRIDAHPDWDDEEVAEDILEEEEA